MFQLLFKKKVNFELEHKEKNDDKFSIMIRLHNLHHNKMIMFKFFLN